MHAIGLRICNSCGKEILRLSSDFFPVIFSRLRVKMIAGSYPNIQVTITNRDIESRYTEITDQLQISHNRLSSVRPAPRRPNLNQVPGTAGESGAARVGNV